MVNYAKHVAEKNIPQTESLPGQVQNSAGGYSFEVDCWTKLDRFLILGTEGGSYYASEKKLTADSAKSVLECYTTDPKRTVDRIIKVSDQGLAAKNDAAIFALAFLSRDKYAMNSLSLVCRTATHLFQFVENVNSLRGWSRGLRTAVSNWYLNQNVDDLAYQLTKYRNREGWTHRDVLRKCHASSKEETVNNLLRWAVNKPVESKHDLIKSFELAQSTTDKNELISLIRDKNLVRECIPNTWFKDKDVWAALLEKMPMTALIRNLGKLSEVGLLTPMSQTAIDIATRIRDEESLKKSRIHPLKVLLALKAYQSGTSRNISWTACKEIIEALDDAFYLSFQNVQSTNKRYLLALDVSGSMTSAIQNTAISCRDASGALAMIALHTEPLCHTMAFSTGFINLNLNKKQSLNDVIAKISNLPFQGTDCALPMIYALQHKIPVDVFVIYTDSETWHGAIHPTVALKEYRNKMQINSKLIVVGMAANNFSIADPNDKGMLDVVGFDASIPDVMRSFVIG